MLKIRHLLVLVVPLACGASVVSLAWADRRSSEVLAAGLTIAGVDVGGLTGAEAMDRVWRDVRRRTMRPVVVEAGGRASTLTAADAGLRVRLPEAVSRAQNLSREGSLLERGWHVVAGRRLEHDIALRPTVSDEAIERFVARLARRVEVPARDAAFDLGVAEVSVDAERSGRRLARREELARRIRAAFVHARRERSFRATVERVRPAVTREELWRANPVAVTVSRSARLARVFRRGQLVKTYRVAVGERKSPTPLGVYEVQAMQKNPTWHVPQSEWAGDLAGKTIPPGDPRNPLIARWIGFNGSVGFHGTKSVDSIGRAASKGCVRMRRADVVDLYRRVQVGATILVGR